MRLDEIKKQLTRAEKDAKRDAGKNELAKIDAANKEKALAARDAKYNNGEALTIKLPVIGSNGKITTQEFIIDNYLKQRHAMQDVRLKDLSKVPALPGDRKEKSSFIIDMNTKHTEGSIAAYLHGLPSGTKRKAGAEPNDFRREAYTA